jgi:hypothetical protein
MFGLRFRDFSSAPDLFSGPFIRTAFLDRQKITVISDARFRCTPRVESPMTEERKYAILFAARRLGTPSLQRQRGLVLPNAVVLTER